jgi:NAD(P)-dependent dehydrogenase (short-subunit alcohol dehydrogenase family)
LDVGSRFRLDGRTALVSGAGRGIGRACALALAEAGAEVLLLSRTAQELEEAAFEITGKGGRATAICCDVTDSQAVKKVFAALPSLDVLVNNAGSNIPEPFVEVSEAHLDRLLELNVRAAFIVAQAAARKMLASPNRYARAIINMSSQMGHVGSINRSVYCLTKHALEDPAHPADVREARVRAVGARADPGGPGGAGRRRGGGGGLRRLAGGGAGYRIKSAGRRRLDGAIAGSSRPRLRRT